MSVFKVKLIRKELVSNETMAFHFEKPAGFKFQAGQYNDYILINPVETDAEGAVRSFTLACAPFEDDIMFVTRMRNTAFKRVIKDMPIGTEMKVDGPNGNFVLKQNQYPAVFLTGGIGVTPARSVIAQASHDGLGQQIILFYSNKTLDSAVFMDELYILADSNKNLKFIPTITGPPEHGFQGETGHIDVDMLHKYVPDLSKPNYYITGPISLVNSLRQLLVANGVKKRNIFTEEFVGYA